MLRRNFVIVITLAMFSSGLGVSFFTRAGADSLPTALTSAQARGKTIYTTSRNSSGEPLSFRLLSAGDGLLPANGIVCANCHGQDGKGAREGNTLMADIRYATLTRPLSVSPPRHRTRAPYTDALLARAITRGIDASGNQLEAAMPRWVLSEIDLRDLLAYLKTL